MNFLRGCGPGFSGLHARRTYIADRRTQPIGAHCGPAPGSTTRESSRRSAQRPDFSNWINHDTWADNTSMHLSPLMLSFAAPAALGAIQAAAGLASTVGEHFADALGSQPASPAGDQASFEDRLEHFASRIRGWLHQRGIDGPFEIDLQSKVSGSSAFDVSGPHADKISELIDEQPGWKTELEELALCLQSLAAGMSPAGARLRISQQSADASLL